MIRFYPKKSSYMLVISKSYGIAVLFEDSIGGLITVAIQICRKKSMVAKIDQFISTDKMKIVCNVFFIKHLSVLT